MSQRFTPRRSGRGTGNYEFFELALALGPQAIGVTGDNSYETLYGREYLLVWDLEDDLVKLYRETATDGVWERITDGLPPLFDSPLPATARHVTFAFDQSARVIFVYELAEQVLVTRWNPFTNEYVQNVSFAGVDPCLLMDATVADPRGFPNATDNGWSVREAYFAGIRVLYEWVPDSTFRETAIPDSDIVLFYLTPDRLEVKARVQRELYATVNDIHTFAEPAVMDRAVALSGKYQLLVSDAAGDKRANMLISDAYISDYLVSPQPGDGVGASVSPVGLTASSVIFIATASETIDAAATIPTVVATLVIVKHEDDEAIDGALEPTTITVESLILLYGDEEAVDGGLAIEDVVAETVIIPSESEEALDGTVAIPTIEVRAV